MGHEGICEKLIAAGADVNIPNRVGSTAIHGASDRGRFSIVKHLLAAEADAEWLDNRGRTPLDVASTEEIREYLSNKSIIAATPVPAQIWKVRRSWMMMRYSEDM